MALRLGALSRSANCLWSVTGLELNRPPSTEEGRNHRSMLHRKLHGSMLTFGLEIGVINPAWKFGAIELQAQAEFCYGGGIVKYGHLLTQLVDHVNGHWDLRRQVLNAHFYDPFHRIRMHRHDKVLLLR